jgi:hypothetical protein
MLPVEEEEAELPPLEEARIIVGGIMLREVMGLMEMERRKRRGDCSTLGVK